MQELTTTLAQMTIPQLVANYNALAPARGVPPIKRWRGGHCELATQFAILRTRTPIVKDTTARRRPRKRGLFDATLEALEHIAYYEDRATGERVTKEVMANGGPDYPVVSVGLSFAQVLKRVKKKCPEGNPTPEYIRWVLCCVRDNEGLADDLPTKRPRSNWMKERQTWKRRKPKHTPRREAHRDIEHG